MQNNSVNIKVVSFYGRQNIRAYSGIPVWKSFLIRHLFCSRQPLHAWFWSYGLAYFNWLNMLLAGWFSDSSFGIWFFSGWLRCFFGLLQRWIFVIILRCSSKWHINPSCIIYGYLEAFRVERLANSILFCENSFRKMRLFFCLTLFLPEISLDLAWVKSSINS